MDNCVQECQKKVASYKRELKKFIETQKKEFEKELEEKIKELNRDIAAQQELLSQLGIFKFSEKNEAKKEIKKLEARILKYQDPTLISTEISSMEEKMEEAVEKYQETIEFYLNRRFSDYKTTKKKNPKKDLLYVENEECARAGCPSPVEVKKIFE